MKRAFGKNTQCGPKRAPLPCGEGGSSKATGRTLTEMRLLRGLDGSPITEIGCCGHILNTIIKETEKLL